MLQVHSSHIKRDEGQQHISMSLHSLEKVFICQYDKHTCPKHSSCLSSHSFAICRQHVTKAANNSSPLGKMKDMGGVKPPWLLMAGRSSGRYVYLIFALS